jgi:hypothetical protein
LLRPSFYSVMPRKIGLSGFAQLEYPLLFQSLFQGAGYSESKVETDVADLELETGTTALELVTDMAGLELEIDVP